MRKHPNNQRLIPGAAEFIKQIEERKAEDRRSRQKASRDRAAARKREETAQWKKVVKAIERGRKS